MLCCSCCVIKCLLFFFISICSKFFFVLKICNYRKSKLSHRYPRQDVFSLVQNDCGDDAESSKISFGTSVSLQFHFSFTDCLNFAFVGLDIHLKEKTVTSKTAASQFIFISILYLKSKIRYFILFYPNWIKPNMQPWHMHLCVHITLVLVIKV